ncbi:2-amino-4-hydroxy-6-hydroxymethyldihydropteridine diphosphokinase [Trinickia caryophylli]|uniref:2-amino-4-hydroxy-6-hydroxymethyldihydropteridine pyrophosphokinase n=1 Tax=Trinickia caryophylli TaxID=28094 RepID=A0A1X7CDF3_TRICW|nr:2-amino-4-hydroxy-6-hydroxymethyldihydropteridine diphosphokinase [Trinickia caryophylli]PMS12533.1 2-amino-4-hydroxy-6-hydroxymethyldihydropteridine diphosphokinase [Trinickia caryophylli]TRX19739.1 2-amino-4-hydroxy-6-hydroxymethyldihydropteridine diphosphokinase [Trinickia caryophylli]WQE12943.1 2-amino-4-hydroxy-6-hydroxymethyldihydropteridine diphosphokinase [Trinickia caryophylli]SME94556.1 2-amino-4-hydroxy-6-hydroxymethyldihydropteridinediphosphokinase [Trinickia caryophylli]GLU3067
MTVAYLGLGANLGDARQSLKDAVVCLAQQQTITVLAKSSLYRTAPIDAQGDDYYNLVVKIETSLSPHSLLGLCHSIEHHFGRERPFRNAPRTLDIDIVLFGDERFDAPDLVIPHPRAAERAFVLVPLVEIDVDATIPGVGPAQALLSAVADQRIEKVQTCRCMALDKLRAKAGGSRDDTSGVDTSGVDTSGGTPPGNASPHGAEPAKSGCQ